MSNLQKWYEEHQKLVDDSWKKYVWGDLARSEESCFTGRGSYFRGDERCYRLHGNEREFWKFVSELKDLYD